MVGASKYLFSFLSNTLTILGGIVLIIFLSIYIGAEPEVYRGWMLSVVPAHHRAQMRIRAGRNVDGAAKMARHADDRDGGDRTREHGGAALLGVKAPYALAIIAGLMEFVPTIGPLISAVPAILMAFVDSPQLAAYVALAYWAIQFVENNLLIPFLMRGEMDLPPAITIVAQALMTVVFGFIGLMVAVPLTAAVLVPIRMIADQGKRARAGDGSRSAHRKGPRGAGQCASRKKPWTKRTRARAPASIRATRRGKVARRSAELGT